MSKPTDLTPDSPPPPPGNASQGTGLVQARRRPRKIAAALRYRLMRLARPKLQLPPQELLEKLPSAQDNKSRQMSFTFAVIALAARVATVDGPLSMSKYLIFRESFPLEDGMCSKIRSLFILACHNDTPISYYVGQLRYSFPEKPALMEAVLERLFAVASADSELSAEAEDLLAIIAHGLDIPAGRYSRLLSHFTGPRKPYHVLGLHKGAAPEHVKSRYRELMRQYHPDSHAASDLSQEVELLLQLKSSEINAAYRALAKRAA